MSEQLSLSFSEKTSSITSVAPAPPVSKPVFSTILESLPSYKDYLTASGKSNHTVDSFSGDIKKLAQTFPDKHIPRISTEDLRSFITSYAEHGRKPKTLHRKVVALKNYFAWLTNRKWIAENPAALLVFARVVPPLPDILTQKETSRFLEASMRTPLERTLIMILLGAGLKRSELINLTKNDIDTSDSLPFVTIRTGGDYRKRTVRLPIDFIQAYKDYLETYKPENILFIYTERTLNNILKSIATRAGISKKVSCQILRDTFAVQSLLAGESINDMLKKLGLAPDPSNREIAEKYKRLSEFSRN